jgi:hypothetical protein
VSGDIRGELVDEVGRRLRVVAVRPGSLREPAKATARRLLRGMLSAFLRTLLGLVVPLLEARRRLELLLRLLVERRRLSELQ